MNQRPRFQTVPAAFCCTAALLTAMSLPGQQAQAPVRNDIVQQSAALEQPTIPVRGPAAETANVPGPPAAVDLNKDIDLLPATEVVGDSLQARGRFLAAQRVFERIQPRTAVISNKIGVASEHLLMFDKAKLSFEEALKLNPKYAEACNNLATVYHSRGDLGHAEKLYRRAIQLKPQNADSWQNLGALYYSKRKFKKGDEAYREAVRIDPGILERSASRGIHANGSKQNSAEMHYHLACTSAEAGNHNLALDYLRRSILEGFHDRQRVLHEKMFADLRTSPVFLQIVDDMRKN